MRVILAPVFLVLAPLVFAHELVSECQRLTLNERGEVTSWSVACGAETVDIWNDEGGFGVRLEDNSEMRRLADWSLSTASDSITFASTGVSRQWRLAGDNRILLDLTVPMAEESANRKFVLRITPGWSTRHEGDGLAAYVYEFQRIFWNVGGELAPAAAEFEDLEGELLVYTRHGVVSLRDFWSNHQGMTLRTGEDRQIDLTIPRGSLDSKVRIGFTAAVYPALGATLRKSEVDGVMFTTLWAPLRILSSWLEKLLAEISRFAGGPAVAVCLLALMMRVLTYPLNRWGENQQSHFVAVQEQISVKISAAKSELKGARQSERIVAIYTEHGVTPFTGLKGSLPLLIQLPVLIAIFNVTTESALFHDQAVLWITDLSLPDRMVNLGFGLPMLGSGLNVLPLLLGLVGWYAARDQAGTKLSGLFLHVLITAVFYSFAASLVLYWLCVNLLQLAEKRIARRVVGRNIT